MVRMETILIAFNSNRNHKIPSIYLNDISKYIIYFTLTGFINYIHERILSFLLRNHLLFHVDYLTHNNVVFWALEWVPTPYLQVLHVFIVIAHVFFFVNFHFPWYSSLGWGITYVFYILFIHFVHIPLQHFSSVTQ